MFVTKYLKFPINYSPKLILAGSFGLICILLFPLFNIGFEPATLSGHPWKVELASSIFTSILLIYFLSKNQHIDLSNQFSNKNLKIIIFSFLLFIIWSGVSIIWAESWQSVAHHTLVWSVYLIIFAVFYIAHKNIEFLRLSLIFLGILTWIISVSCLLSYLEVLINPTAESIFRVTFSKFSEILTLTVPFFTAIFLFTKRKNSLFYGATCVVSWSAIVVSLSRASFLAVIGGMCVLGIFFIIYLRNRKYLKKAIIIISIFTSVGIIGQFTSISENSTLYGRFMSTSQYQLASNNIRLLLINVSSSMIRANPVIGVGADNYYLNLNKYRAAYAKENSLDKNLAAGEDLTLQRPHNEFLQIISELGLVGLILFLSLTFACFITIIKLLRKNTAEFQIIIRIGACAGLSGFLISSLFSSFSFRAIQNGIVFFVILTIALAELGYSKKKSNADDKLTKPFLSKYYNPILASGVVVSCLLIFISVNAAISQYYVYRAEKENNLIKAEHFYKQAISFDASNSSAYFSYGIKSLFNKQPKKSSALLQISIENGIDVTTVYSYLASSQILAGDSASAEKTLKKGLEIFPYSIFLRIRYANLLDENGNQKEAEKQIEFANKIDKKQAAGWYSLIYAGVDETALRIRNKDDLPDILDLSPTGGVYAVIDEHNLTNRFPSRMARNQ